MVWPGNPFGDILRVLEERYGPLHPPPLNGPLEMVLWEQVAYLADDARRLLAFDALRSRIGTEAGALARAGKPVLTKIAALGGIFAELRAERILRSAAIVQMDFAGDLSRVPELPLPKAKKALMRFDMIGEPGAEKILLFCGKLNVLALESNGLRVLTRVGLVTEAKSYSATYRAARAVTLPLAGMPNAQLQQAHLLLRRHGLELCFRTAPACHSCPLAPACPAASPPLRRNPDASA